MIKIKHLLSTAAAISLLLSPLHSATEIEPEFTKEIEQLADLPKIRKAFKKIEDLDEQSLEELIMLTEIPAPPFKEEKRAKVFKKLLKEAGLENVEIDEEGNVIGIRKGTSS